MRQTAFESMPITGYIEAIGTEESYARFEPTGSQFLPHNIRYALEKDKRYPVKDTYQDSDDELWYRLEDGLYVFADERVSFTPVDQILARDPMTDKRHALLRILNEFRVARNDYLHDGRQTVFDAEGYLTRIEAVFAPSLFQQVMEASKSYVERFGGTLDEDGTVTKFTEESDEFYEAATDYTAYRNDYEAQQHKQRMLGEAFDVMVTLGGVLSYFGVTWDQIERAGHETLKKLTDRKPSDYVWDEASKTVIKRSKLEAGS